ncbi:MAG: hypothetical protein Q4A01_10265, partial [Coriobacteriales bacterium]|nr:hypothetical protein [Coriobacteriales bacterium]
MARRRQMFGGLPRLALSLFVTLATVLGMCPTAGIAEEVMVEPEGKPAVEVTTEGNADASQKKDGEEPALQVQTDFGLWVGNKQVTSDNMRGEGWRFDASCNTLTLNGANITTGHDKQEEGVCGIHYTGTDLLTIVVASDSTVDVSEVSADTTTGIFCKSSGLTITGAGKLTVKGNPVGEGISAEQNVTIDKGVVDATGGNGGIMARKGGVVINNGSTVKANGSINGTTVTIDGGTVKASSKGSGIFGHSVTIRGGEVTATATAIYMQDGLKGYGIEACFKGEEPGRVTITGGTVSATGYDNCSGIYAQNQEIDGIVKPGTVTIDSSIASVTASGGKRAIEGTVKNAVAGMGWTDAAGTQGKAAIAIAADGQDLGAYKKVQFPTPVAKVTTAPEATNPTHSGEPQELVTVGTAEGGTMRYSLDGETWSEKVPTGTDEATYTVWYKAVGDDQHADSEPQKVTSTIKKAEAPPVSVTAHVQRRGTLSAVSGGAIAGTTGKSLRLESLRLAVDGASVSGGIEYRGHVQRKGWEKSWAKDGAMAGTEGKSRRLEAVQVRLWGDMAAKYDVWYRVHSQRYGWMAWAKNGESAGTQ